MGDLSLNKVSVGKKREIKKRGRRQRGLAWKGSC